MKQQLIIKEYEVWVNLGCGLDEQAYKQPVFFDVTIDFSSVVIGSKTDHLKDTVDYVAITDLIRHRSTSKPYHLIEHLCQSVHTDLEDYLKKQNYHVQLTTQVLKKRPPIPYLQGGVYFSCQSHWSI